MPVHRPFTTKTFEHTEAGELICFPIDGGAHEWGIVLGVGETGMRQVGLLRSGDTHYPSFSMMESHESTDCISFGTKWVLEPLPLLGEVSRHLRDEVGSWIIQGETVALRFSWRPRHMGTRAISLETFETANLGLGMAVGGRYWRLWASEAERADPRARPLIEVMPS